MKNRKDARRIEIPALMQCCIDLKPKRMENEVYINRKIDVTNLVEFIETKKAEGIHYTYFHAFLTAIGKVIYNKPKLNRFIANRHLYQHNDVLLSFVAKVTLDEASSEIMLTLPVKPEDTIDSISENISSRVEKLRQKKTESNTTGGAIDFLAKLPNAVRVPIFGLIKALDKKGRVPSALTDNNIYFSSMIVSNLGSIGCGAIYHNLANFGSCSSLAAIGEITTEIVEYPDGTKKEQKFCEFGITLDERIADGFYYAKSVGIIEYILAHPALLLEPVSGKIEL